MAKIGSMGIRACLFDAYGTLFDVHSAVGQYIDLLGRDAAKISELWRNRQLEYTWLRSLMHKHADFWQVTQDALDFALDSYGIDDKELRQKLLDAYLRLDCYPEVAQTLKDLKDRDVGLAILSNGSPMMLKAAVENAGLKDHFDAILSVEEAGVFKVDPRTYQLGVDYFNVSAAELCFLSSNAWDVAGAATFGLNVVWVNRFGQKPERLPGEPVSEIKTLKELPLLLSN
ncbi:MAG: haloacid dehalogenase type II [Desulfuromonas sp.]|nr:MAG: haloacid dehalogenase type II [Desulfuromonas sp.]